MKTKDGMTREIEMEIGGKQGSRLTGRMFAKLLDMLAEELLESGEGFTVNDVLIIAVLLWVDDVISCVDGEENQKKMLQKVHEFALKHILVWGQSKCKVIRVGKHNDTPKEWNLGYLKIEETASYKYLGDVITNDGRNGKNLEARQNNSLITTVTINSIAESEVMRNIGTRVLIEMHEKKNLSGILTNAESWILNQGEKTKLERIEIQSIKYLFDLPAHTPTPAIVFAFGLLYTNVRVDKKRFIYLHHILNRDPENWTRITLETIQEMDIGWGKSIKEALREYGLPTDFTEIGRTHVRQWERIVSQRTEIMNQKRLYNDCHKRENQQQTVKTKTAHILSYISAGSYTKKPLDEIMQCNKYDTKTIIIARFGMLDSGKNNKGNKPEICSQCNVIDDENHRLNNCINFRDINFYDSDIKVDFRKVFSNDIDTLREILPSIQRVRNTKTAK